MSRWRCPACGYVYDEAPGHPREGFPAGTNWSEVPDDWACPDCGVRDKVDFEKEGEEEGERLRGPTPRREAEETAP
ncbi:MAG TPA: rubredoxin [Solirubrobacteraceae bacterium]|jgi:rubredoxin|nr:rubredoxin [Solirubrobacteraceae bacterium]